MSKISLLMLHLGYGGIEKQVTTLANNLINKNYDVEIISFYKLNEHSAYPLNKKIKIKYILEYGPNREEFTNALKSKKIIKLFKESLEAIRILYLKKTLIKKEINNLDTDIIISSRIEFTKLIKRKDCLVIFQEHNYMDSSKYLNNLKKATKYVNYLVVMTNKAKKEYQKYVNNKTKVVCIPNMIEKVDGVSKCETKEIISVGRLHELKNYSLLIEIYSIIKQKHPSWKLKIIGDGSEKGNLQEKIRNLKLENDVILTGMLDKDKVTSHLLNSSIFVLTSKRESFSLVLCEANECGLPVISFDIEAGPREIIENEVNGFLIEEGNIDEMANKICYLIENENERKKMSKTAKEYASKYHDSVIIEKWINLFNNKIN